MTSEFMDRVRSMDDEQLALTINCYRTRADEWGALGYSSAAANCVGKLRFCLRVQAERKAAQ
jgi:hypothetical protein